MAVLEQLNQQGQTLILVTHEADIAQRAQRCLYFKDGRLLRDQQLRDQQLLVQQSAASHSPAVI